MGYRLYLAFGSEFAQKVLDPLDTNADGTHDSRSGAVKVVPARQFMPPLDKKGKVILEIDPTEANFSRFKDNFKAWLPGIRATPDIQNLNQYLENPEALNITFHCGVEELNLIQSTIGAFSAVPEHGLHRVTVTLPPKGNLNSDQLTRLENFYIQAAGEAGGAEEVAGRFGPGIATLFDYAGEAIAPSTVLDYYNAGVGPNSRYQSRLKVAFAKFEELSASETFADYPLLSGADMARGDEIKDLIGFQIGASMQPYQERMKKEPKTKNQVMAEARAAAQAKREPLTRLVAQLILVLVEITGVREAYQNLARALKKQAPGDDTSFDDSRTPENESTSQEWTYLSFLDATIKESGRKQMEVAAYLFRLKAVIDSLTIQMNLDAHEKPKPKKPGTTLSPAAVTPAVTPASDPAPQGPAAIKEEEY
ncbi:MAG: hypothetical protein Q7T11_07985 [Deltaproteobacteria bacterium]|nr:hypothetical protein [Deltaproteobacteria bacterium]